MYTIQDVAKKAGVSVATVSRVINNSTKVSEKSRVKVEAAIQELNYQPNLLGRNLRRSETKKILVLLPTLASGFYSKVIKGMDHVASDHGYKLMMSTTRMKKDKEEGYLELLKTKLVDGVIFTRPVIGADELTQYSRQFPIVQCCEYVEGAKVSSVSINDELAGYEAVKYLIKSGHKRIAILTCSADISSRLRLKGYKKILTENNIPIREEYIKDTNYSFKTGIEVTKQLFDLEEPPTAIFTVSDSLAIGAMKSLYSINKTPGSDVAVIGFDNTEIAAMYHPTLSTVAQPRYELGRMAMELLISTIKSGEYNEITHMRLNHELIIRESS
ncbi:LacI family DNA-binding transcriptional regulator [Vallitalea okinawensis]|uniref:LacI family DNA-binding transcriptional regulator n=1 Tax=Vallitalea okinawensis TaxID=2078660 RepID=UPI000CFDF230|nr:LacI family DNA-binding transcriptional regulator [Vallitalea okinawensis]